MGARGTVIFCYEGRREQKILTESAFSDMVSAIWKKGSQ